MSLTAIVSKSRDSLGRVKRTGTGFTITGFDGELTEIVLVKTEHKHLEFVVVGFAPASNLVIYYVEQSWWNDDGVISRAVMVRLSPHADECRFEALKDPYELLDPRWTPTCIPEFDIIRGRGGSFRALHFKVGRLRLAFIQVVVAASV